MSAEMEAKRHMEAAAPLEGCGVLVRGRGALRFQCWPNLAAEPRHGFAMDARATLHAGTPDGPVAVLHSHVHPAPRQFSQADIKAQQAMGCPWGLIYIGEDGRAEERVLWLGRKRKGAGDDSA